jgi:hypothetical protein
LAQANQIAMLPKPVLTMMFLNDNPGWAPKFESIAAADKFLEIATKLEPSFQGQITAAQKEGIAPGDKGYPKMKDFITKVSEIMAAQEEYKTNYGTQPKK